MKTVLVPCATAVCAISVCVASPARASLTSDQPWVGTASGGASSTGAAFGGDAACRDFLVEALALYGFGAGLATTDITNVEIRYAASSIGEGAFGVVFRFTAQTPIDISTGGQFIDPLDPTHHPEFAAVDTERFGYKQQMGQVNTAPRGAVIMGVGEQVWEIEFVCVGDPIAPLVGLGDGQSSEPLVTSFSIVPAPGALALLGLGLVSRRRR